MKIDYILGVGTGYSWFCLSFFVLLFSCATHSSCSLPACLCLLEKRRKLRLFCGAQVFFVLFSLLLTSRSRHACLRLTEKRWKIAPYLQIQASSMKLIVVFFLYTKVFHFDKKKKKRKRALRPDSFLFQWFWLFLKYFNSNLNLSSYSLFSKCFSRFFYLGVHRGTGVFAWFLLYSLSRADSPSRSLRACLRLTKKRRKIASVLQIQTSLMKLRVHGFLFLFFLHIKTDGKNKLFFMTTSTFR